MATTTLTGTTGNNLLNAPGSVSTLVQGLQGADTINLALANDEAQAGKGSDIVSIARTGIVVNTIFGGDGNDTVNIRSAAQFGGYVDLGAGNDTINITAALINGGQIYGGEGADTIRYAGSTVNTTMGGGSGADLLSFSGAAATITSSRINGGKNQDTINLLLTAASSFVSVEGGQGSDVISGTGINFANSYLGGGKGTDSITVIGSTVGSVAGGGLNDTIRIAAFAGGVIYGDALGVTTAGTGTDGGADGADLISGGTAQLATASTSIYGAGGADTISLTAGQFNSTQNVVDGGDAADSINILGSASFGTVTGGAGNDSIELSGDYAAAAAVTAKATVSGGAGTDLIKFSGGSASFLLTDSSTANGLETVSAATYAGIISGASGDTLRLLTGVTFGTTANWAVAGTPTIYNGTSIAFSGASAAGAATSFGSLAVWSNGTDSVIGVRGGTSLFQRFLIKGVDLTITTVTQAAVIATATTFRFTVAANTGGGMNITFA